MDFNDLVIPSTKPINILTLDTLHSTNEQIYGYSVCIYKELNTQLTHEE
ncbi:unnamed protein product (macronuclear) [Paramecium tetraurelia]|uniref:Uncharacterized protein n=1 Tax=Paramecium tetraurelia TaxID=5888 RepID=A0CHI5_PARTE|nr:uncharacterized protein GSPATT00038354001 [Paramecium tetraurelia]CAK70252.1 unnamed protein product [Paramecium tetraurelia]|eukprot:XP_001437649.1 hypothetical protein (macronuclear) [Paramecium tetraurelia strain d4-2]